MRAQVSLAVKGGNDVDVGGRLSDYAGARRGERPHLTGVSLMSSKTPKPPISPWQTLSREELARTPIFALMKARRRHPTDAREGDFYQIDSPDWVNILAITAQEQVVLVRQYRHGIDQVTLEIPGGCVDPGELPLDAAKRELMEETGYQSDRWEQIGYITANPAFMTNGCTTFIAHEARQVGPQRPDEHEELGLELHPLSQLHDLVRAGQIHHGIVVCAAYHLLLRQLKGKSSP